MKLMPGEFFEMPSAVFQMDLTPEELATYAYLRYRKNNRTHKCWPSYKTIGEAIGRSRKSVAKYVSALEEKGLIKTETTEMITKGGVPLNGNLMYTILPVRPAVEQFNRRLIRRAEVENERRRVQAVLNEKGAWGRVSRRVRPVAPT